MARDTTDLGVDQRASAKFLLLGTNSRVISLNLVILRPGLVYGPYVEYGVRECLSQSVCAFVIENLVVPSTLTVAAVYGYLKKPMKGLCVYSV